MIVSLPCRAHFGRAKIVRKARSLLRETPYSPPVPPLPEGEGYSRTLRNIIY